MRKILALVSVLALVQTANAESNLTTGAEFRTRVQNDMNTTANDDTGQTQNNWVHRLKVNMDWNVGEKFSAHTSLIHNTQCGQGDICNAQQTNTTGTLDSGPAVRNGVGDAQNMLLVNEAYGTWMMSDSTSLRFGRGAFTIADGSVIATNDWQNQPYAFDGALLTHDMEFGRLSGFYVKFADFANGFGGATVDDPETQAYGLSLDVKAVPDAIKMLNVHVVQVLKDETPTSTTVPQNGESSLRYGLTVGGDVAGVDYNATYAMVGGENLRKKQSLANQDIASSMYDVKVGYTLPDLMGFRIGVDYHSDTGSSSSSTKDETYDSFYYEMHDNAGAMDIFKWGNLTYVGVNLSMVPMENTRVGIDYYMFSQTEKDGTSVGNINGNYFATNANNAAEDELGSELDVWASHKYENGLETYVRYSMFTPGAEFKNLAEDTYSLVFVEAKMNF